MTKRYSHPDLRTVNTRFNHRVLALPRRGCLPTFSSPPLTTRCTTSGTFEPSGPTSTPCKCAVPLLPPRRRFRDNAGMIALAKLLSFCSRTLPNAPPRRNADSNTADMRTRATAARGSTDLQQFIRSLSNNTVTAQLQHSTLHSTTHAEKTNVKYSTAQSIARLRVPPYKA